MKPTEFFSAVLVLAIFLVLIILVGSVAIDRTAIAQCKTWQMQSEQYPLFYLTQNQKDQCDYYSITINAPVIPVIK
jgi:hypothetical protein